MQKNHGFFGAGTATMKAWDIDLFEDFPCFWHMGSSPTFKPQYPKPLNPKHYTLKLPKR